MKPFDTDKMPWLFTPHGEGELNEYFSSDHSIVISETSKEVIASLSETVTGSQGSYATPSITISADTDTRSCGLRI